MDDANINNAVKFTLIYKINNCGQICVSPKRFIIPEEKVDKFVTKCFHGIKFFKNPNLNSDIVYQSEKFMETELIEINGLWAKVSFITNVLL